ncbi:hypothetical protein D9M71_713940 [compost metagenome]
MVGQQFRGVDVEATGLHIRPDRAEGREVLRNGHLEDAALDHILQAVGVGGCLGQHQAGKQGGEEGAETLGHGKSPNRQEVISADRQSMGHANIGFWGRQSAVLLASNGLTGLNSQVVFRTPMAQP